jgi:hypothetical protein
MRLRGSFESYFTTYGEQIAKWRPLQPALEAKTARLKGGRYESNDKGETTNREEVRLSMASGE